MGQSNETELPEVAYNELQTKLKEWDRVDNTQQVQTNKYQSSIFKRSMAAARPDSLGEAE
jgi:hypothetical protein